MDDVTLIGETDFRDKKIKFGVKIDDRRRHFYIIGRSGTGKTTLEETLAIYDIQHGRGVGVIDPHGEFSERLLKFVPQERIDDVVYFNPSDIDYPIGFNVLEDVSFELRHIMASSLLSVFKKIWPDVWSARMEYILSNAILALLEYQDSTLLSINRLLADKDFRKEVVHNLRDPIVKAFWTDEFARYHDRFQVEAIAPIQNKVGQFVSNPLIRNIVGQKQSKINLRNIMDSNKILIVRLPVGLIGEVNTSLLGGLLITKLQQAAMSRIDLPEAERKDFFLFIDEFQNFATESFVNILAEARKYRLDLTLAHQYIEQIPDEIRSAVLGTVGSLAVFRIGPRDAEILKTEFEPEITAADLVNIPNWKFYIKLMINGVVSAPFLGSTLAPQPVPEVSFEEEIINQSRKKYATQRSQVEKDIMDWMQTIAGQKVDKEKNLEKEMPEIYPGVCQSCGRNIQIPFKPDPNKPLYCKKCLKNIRRQKVKTEEGKEEREKGKEEKAKEQLQSQASKKDKKPFENKFKEQLAALLKEVAPAQEKPQEKPQEDSGGKGS